MKRFGVLLVLIMVLELFSVSPVALATTNEKMRVVFTLSETYDVQQALQALNWTNATHQYDTTTWVTLDGQHIIVSSSDLFDLFTAPAGSTPDMGDYKAKAIATEILTNLKNAGVLGADAYFSDIEAQSELVTNARYVYIIHYNDIDTTKNNIAETLRAYIVKTYPMVYYQFKAYTDWDWGFTAIDIIDYTSDPIPADSGKNNAKTEYYYDGIGKPTKTGGGIIDISLWNCYVQNKEVGVYTRASDKYTANSYVKFRFVFFSDTDYSSGIPAYSGVSGAKGVDAANIIQIQYSPVRYSVLVSLKDALTGQPLSGVTVKEGDTTLGTIDDGGSLELAKGTHELTFEKTGYWSVTKTIDVQSDMTVSVEMYPSSAAFKLENFPSDITIPENTIYELTFTLSPIQTSATYNTYLSLSGLSDIIEVRKDGSVISPESGKYYLGDISGDTQVSIKFKAGAVGTHGFTLTLTSNDAIMSKTYTTTKQVTYKVEPLPFSVQMPGEWQVGENQLRISESSGQSYLITAVLKDSQGNEVWSDSHAFSPYEAHTFTVNVPSEGSYTLELQWKGKTAVYDITVNPAITLVTKTLTVEKGGEGVITLHFKNPSSNVQYYTIKVSGGFLPKEINQSISVAPLTEKDVSIAFAVPDNLQYDAYELNVAVMQGNATVFTDKVAVSISNDGGFSLFGGSSSGGKTLYYGLAALVGLGLFIAILRRR